MMARDIQYCTVMILLSIIAYEVVSEPVFKMLSLLIGSLCAFACILLIIEWWRKGP